MKNLKSIILSTGFAFITAASVAQVPETSASATITTDNCVTLDATQPLQNFYSIDIAHLGLSSEYLVKKHFGHIENNLITYYVDFAHSKVVLELHLDRVPADKDLTWWGEYLTSLCK